MTVIGTVRELWRYPVSSMGGERLEEAEIGPGGVIGDRAWGVVNLRDGEVAGPERRRHWRPLPNLFSRLGPDGPQVGHGDGKWLDAGTEKADALVSKHLAFPATIRPHTAFETSKDDHVAPRYARADLHILTTASMVTLEGLIDDPSQVDARRFRPNIVVETSEVSGFAEHSFVGKRLAIGGLVVAVSEPCARCSFTALAQAELAFEPQVLHRISQHGDGGFGVLCAVEDGSTVRMGDEVKLIDG